MNTEMTSRAFKALSDSTRLHIMEFLSASCCGQAAIQEDGSVEGPTAGEVCCHVTGVDKITSTVSHHLHELENAQFVALEKRGKSTLCTMKRQTLLDLASELSRLAAGTDSCCCCAENCECN